MGFKQISWGLVLAGAAALIATVAVWWITAVPPEERVRAVALEHVRAALAAQGKKEGADFSIGDVSVVSLTPETALVETQVNPEGALLIHELARSGGSWVVSKDLAGDFEKHCSFPEIEREMLKRLGNRILQRFPTQTDLKINPGLRKTYFLRREGGVITGHVDLRFSYPGTQKSGRYVEALEYRDGRWEYRGKYGSLFDAGPPPRQ